SDLLVAISAHLDAWPGGPGRRSNRGGPRRVVLIGLLESCKRAMGLPALAPALPNLQRSGHRAAVTPVGVEEPRSGRLATADADLPSLSYGHLVGDSTGPAQRGKQGASRAPRRRASHGRSERWRHPGV